MRTLAVAAAIEVIAGLVLIVSPSLAARLILHADLNAAGHVIARMGGMGLLSLGVACWPRSGTPAGKSGTACGLLVYNVLAAILFIYVGIRGMLIGPLLWPVAGLHAMLAILVARVVLF
jgi:hypothetical protein